MTELSFLLELLLDHDLQKETQKLIRERIKEIEVKPNKVEGLPPVYRVTHEERGKQAPSMQRAVAEMEQDQAIQANFAQMPPQPAPQSPAVAQAMAHRQALVAQAISGKEEKGRTSPRKF